MSFWMQVWVFGVLMPALLASALWTLFVFGAMVVSVVMGTVGTVDSIGRKLQRH